MWDIASLTKVVGMTTAMMQLVRIRARCVLDAPGASLPAGVDKAAGRSA
jgi:CubicO group peptidase (beta-lactamase class C family)